MNLNVYRSLLRVSFVFLLLPLSWLTVAAENITVGEGQQYQKLNQALLAIEQEGITGESKIEVLPGSYTEQVHISEYFNPPHVSSLLIFSSAEEMDAVEFNFGSTSLSKNYTISLVGCSQVTISNIAIRATGNQFGTAVFVSGQTSDITLESCILSGAQTTGESTAHSLVLLDDRFVQHSIELIDCELEGGSFGVFGGGVSGLELNADITLSGNTLTQQSAAGFYLKYAQNLRITNNVINSLNGLESFTGIALYNFEEGIQVDGNLIHFKKGQYGIHLANVLGNLESPGLIKNNSITLGFSPQSSGFYIEGKTDDLVLDFNRVKFSPGLRDVENYAFYKNLSSGERISMVNNIFYNLDSGGYTVIGNALNKQLQDSGQSSDNFSTDQNVIFYQQVR
jgi:parallel beta-helix repeat protein